MIAPNAYANTAQPLAYLPESQQDAERRRRMREAWKAYRGELQDPLKVAKDQPNDNVKANRCAPIVDKGVSFLFGQNVGIACGDSDNGNTDAMQDAVDAFWGDDDDKMTSLIKIAMNGAICGQAFVKLIPPQAAMKYPRLVILDPQIVRIVTAPDDCEEILAFIIEYPTTGTVRKRQVIARVDPHCDYAALGDADLEDTWTITNYQASYQAGATGAWYQIGEIEDWPYPFAPIFTCQNLPNPNEPYGISDLTMDLVEMNKVLNFILSNISRIIKYHGHPITYATGVASSQIQIAVDDLICLPSPDSKLEKLAAMDNFNGLLSVVSDLRSDMDEQSRVPAVALGRLVDLPKGNISGVALQLLFQPLIEKTILKQRQYGRLIREVTRVALVFCGLLDVSQYATYPVTLHWQNLLPVDDLAAAQTSLIWKQIGVSSTTLLTKAGFDPDDEAGKSAQEAAQQLTAFSRGQGMPSQPLMPPTTPPVPMPAQAQPTATSPSQQT